MVQINNRHSIVLGMSLPNKFQEDSTKQNDVKNKG
jgi:hypothetical protein